MKILHAFKMDAIGRVGRSRCTYMCVYLFFFIHSCRAVSQDCFVDANSAVYFACMKSHVRASLCICGSHCVCMSMCSFVPVSWLMKRTKKRENACEKKHN